MKLFILAAIPLCAILAGCGSIQPKSDINNKGKMTVGVVQKNVREGMSATQVIEAIGSPNIVKKNKTGGETWIYDRFSSEQVTTSVGGALAFLGGDTAAGLSASADAKKTQSHALTVIIHFDEEETVTALAYHRSKF